MKIGNKDYPVIHEGKLSYMLIPVGEFKVNTENGKFRAAEVLVNGYRNPFEVEGKRDFNTHEECQIFCDCHNAAIGFSHEDQLEIRSVSRTYRHGRLQQVCQFCKQMNEANAAYCLDCEHPLDYESAKSLFR